MSVVTVTPAVVEGLRIVVENAERAMSSATHVGDGVLKKHVGGNPILSDYQWFKGDQLARHIEQHGQRILAAVAAYRAAKAEYESARSLIGATP